MKKTALLLVAALLISLAACGSEKTPETTAPTTVSTTQAPTETTVPATTVPETTVPETTASPVFLIAIPDSVTMVGTGLPENMVMQYVYEDGWQDKETFTATAAIEIPGQGSLTITMTYGDKYTSNDMMGVTKTEIHYDEQGRSILQINTTTLNPNVDKIEIATTYDEYGRLLTQETKTYNAGQAEPTVNIETYIYTDTDSGSIGVYTDHAITKELIYDQNYHVVENVTTLYGQESNRVESVYDEYGKLLTQVQYAQGQKVLEYTYTYTIVEVDAETAARLPHLVVQE